MILVLVPVMPFFVLHVVTNAINWFVDFCVLDRNWCNFLADVSEDIADWGDKGLDSDSDLI
jgi:hypothetical protein